MNPENPKSNPENKQPESNLVVVGITGGIGSGKTAVAKCLAESGYTVFTSDITARALMNRHPQLREGLYELFGIRAFLPSGKIDRSYIARKVFGNESRHVDKLRALEKLVHPYVLEEHLAQLNHCAERGEKLVFIESALIFSAGIEDAFDYIILVNAPDDVRIKRVMERDRISEEEVKIRMKRQIPPHEYKSDVDFIIENVGDEAKLIQSVHNLLQIITILPPRTDNDELDEQLSKTTKTTNEEEDSDS
jgi:dephospho-CoA kinase